MIAWLVACAALASETKNSNLRERESCRRAACSGRQWSKEYKIIGIVGKIGGIESETKGKNEDELETCLTSEKSEG